MTNLLKKMICRPISTNKDPEEGCSTGRNTLEAFIPFISEIDNITHSAFVGFIDVGKATRRNLLIHVSILYRFVQSTMNNYVIKTMSEIMIILPV